MLGNEFYCNGSHSNGGPFSITFRVVGDGVDETLLPTTAEISAVLDDLFQSKGFVPMEFYGTDTQRVRMYPPAQPETGV